MEYALNNFRQALREIAAKLGLPAFWRWWMGELAPLVPAAPRAALQRRRLRPILAFGDDVAVLWEPRMVDGALMLAEAARVPSGQRCGRHRTGRPGIDRGASVARGAAAP